MQVWGNRRYEASGPGGQSFKECGCSSWTERGLAQGVAGIALPI